MMHTPRTRLTLLVAMAIGGLAVSCASPGMPPGGLPDSELPSIVRMLPESNAVNVRAPAIVLQFDEVVSERSSAPGAQVPAGGNSLNTVLMISPSDGRDEVVWRRTTLELRPRRGLRPNTAYRVSLMPGLADLRGNRTTQPFEFVFSTGATLPTAEISGVLFDWTTGRAAANARVELFIAPDTNFRWSTRTDSTGEFRLRHLSPATYEVRAWVDANSDRRLSMRELSDTARVALSDTTTLELYAYLRDTVAPLAENVELVDSTAIRVRFDRGIRADWDGLGGVLIGADSAAIPLASPFMRAARYDSLNKQPVVDTTSADTAVTDSLVADTVSADSIIADTLAADTTVTPRFRFNRTVPQTTWIARLTAPLAPGTYRVRIVGAPGLNGRSAPVDREFRVQPPAPPPAVPPVDTAVRRP
jgi:hypothetical protein